MNTFVKMLLTEFTPKLCSTKLSVLDSMPIVTCYETIREGCS